MKIQIINLIPLEYPYQVTRMRKQMPHVVLDYSVYEQVISDEIDVYILIMKEVNAQQLNELNIDKSKIILLVPKDNPDYICWCMPKAFEKEFDAEKLMTYLACMLKKRPRLNLFQSLEIKNGKIHKDPTMKVNVDHMIKGKSEVHLLVKEKTRRVLQVETNRSDVNVYQYWLKGVDPEIDVLVIKRKS